MKKLLMGLVMLGSVSLFASEVYTWGGQSKVYSDEPKNLSTAGVSTVNIRTHETQLLNKDTKGTKSSKVDSSMTLAERQAQLSLEIAEENKKTEARNKQIEERNREREDSLRQENCRIAKTNLKNVQTANRVEDREGLIARYEADETKYCQ